MAKRRWQESKSSQSSHCFVANNNKYRTDDDVVCSKDCQIEVYNQFFFVFIRFLEEVEETRIYGYSSVFDYKSHVRKKKEEGRNR